ncbi:MAG TPA: class D sortase [Candidatus Dormibacteraeota bacterium]
MISRTPRDRPHPLRLAALVILFAGLVTMTVFAGGMLQGVQEQQHLIQTWNADNAHRPVGVPAFDLKLRQPVDGVDFEIRVPRLGYSAAVKEGVTTSVLYSSPGHYPETVWPGDPGTVGVAAHNVYWINFPQLTPGDEIDVQTLYGTYKYHVTGSAIVDPNNRSVLVPNAPGYHLTLTTCWPLWAGAFATQRYVIFSDQYAPQTD